MDTDQDEERARLLAEMRAYGPALPFRQDQPRPPRQNVFDQATAEWMRSRTFKTIVLLVIGPPLLLICLAACAVIVTGASLMDALARLGLF
jgi:hypothetical protein